MGGGRVKIKSLENSINEDIIAHIRGKMRKNRKQFVHLNDVVKVAKRDFTDKVCDVLAVYTEEQKRELIRLNQIKNIHLLNTTNDLTGIPNQSIDNNGKEIEDVFNFEDIWTEIFKYFIYF